jgi:hypothetical protein
LVSFGQPKIDDAGVSSDIVVPAEGQDRAAVLPVSVITTPGGGVIGRGIGWAIFMLPPARVRLVDQARAQAANVDGSDWALTPNGFPSPLRGGTAHIGALRAPFFARRTPTRSVGYGRSRGAPGWGSIEGGFDFKNGLR